jgi:uncharacterized membrane protein
MVKTHRATLIAASVVTVLPVLFGVVCWNRLPEVMAIHFGMDGEANGFSGKAFAVFGLPALLLAVLWLGAFVASRDPKSANVDPKMQSLVLWIVPAVSVFVAVTMYSVNLGMELDVALCGVLLLGLMLTVVGYYLPKARQNHTVGIRIPWTLANEENWNRTHRLAGRLWVASGILMVTIGLTRVVAAEWLAGMVLTVALVPCAYSYWLHAGKGL